MPSQLERAIQEALSKHARIVPPHAAQRSFRCLLDEAGLHQTCVLVASQRVCSSTLSRRVAGVVQAYTAAASPRMLFDASDIMPLVEQLYGGDEESVEDSIAVLV